MSQKKLIFNVSYSDIQLAKKELDEAIKEAAEEGGHVEWTWIPRTCPIAWALISQGFEDVKVLNDHVLIDGRQKFRLSLAGQTLTAAWDYYAATGRRLPNYKEWLGKPLYAVLEEEYPEYQ